MKKIIGIFLCFSMIFISCGKKDTNLKVICIGASNTRGYQLPDLDNNCYPGQLQTLFGEKAEVVNYGVGGTTIMKDGDMSYWDTLSFRQAEESEPDIVIFDFGWNDMKPVNRGQMEDNFVKDYCEMIELFAAMPSRPDIYIILPPLYGTEKIKEDFRYLNGFYQEIIEKENITPIDLYTPMIDVKNFYNSDLTHYSVAGCGRAAEEVYKVVSEDLL